MKAKRYFVLDSAGLLHALGYCDTWHDAHEAAHNVDTQNDILAVFDETDARDIYQRIEGYLYV